jgi:hypothetical protein
MEQIIAFLPLLHLNRILADGNGSFIKPLEPIGLLEIGWRVTPLVQGRTLRTPRRHAEALIAKPFLLLLQLILRRRLHKRLPMT